MIAGFDATTGTGPGMAAAKGDLALIQKMVPSIRAAIAAIDDANAVYLGKSRAVAAAVPARAEPSAAVPSAPVAPVYASPQEKAWTALPQRSTAGRSRALIDARYDRFKNITDVEMKHWTDQPQAPMWLFDRNGGRTTLAIEMWTTFFGEHPGSPPRRVMMTFTAHNTSYSSQVSLLADGKRLNTSSRGGRLGAKVGNSLMAGYEMVEIPLEDFVELLCAQVVEGRGFDVEFTLTADQQEALKDFGSRLAPPEQ